LVRGTTAGVGLALPQFVQVFETFQKSTRLQATPSL
jgi:hypothetical protein